MTFADQSWASKENQQNILQLSMKKSRNSKYYNRMQKQKQNPQTNKKPKLAKVK